MKPSSLASLSLAALDRAHGGLRIHTLAPAQASHIGGVHDALLGLDQAGHVFVAAGATPRHAAQVAEQVRAATTPASTIGGLAQSAIDLLKQPVTGGGTVGGNLLAAAGNVAMNLFAAALEDDDKPSRATPHSSTDHAPAYVPPPPTFSPSVVPTTTTRELPEVDDAAPTPALHDGAAPSATHAYAPFEPLVVPALPPLPGTTGSPLEGPTDASALPPLPPPYVPVDWPDIALAPDLPAMPTLADLPPLPSVPNTTTDGAATDPYGVERLQPTKYG